MAALVAAPASGSVTTRVPKGATAVLSVLLWLAGKPAIVAAVFCADAVTAVLAVVIALPSATARLIPLATLLPGATWWAVGVKVRPFSATVRPAGVVAARL